MTPKRTSVTPTLQAQIIALREAGYTNLAISKRLGIGVRTVQRHLTSAGVKKGSLKNELIEQAREEALSLLRSDPAIKQAIAQLLIDDLAHVSHVRELMVEASEHLKATDVKTAALVLRGAAAYSTAIKNTSDVLQKHLSKHDHSDIQDLPTLIVQELTAEQIERMREENFVRDGNNIDDDSSSPPVLYDD